MADHNLLGELGEQRAQAYLHSNGYKIKHVNWTFGKLEIDIVAEKDGWLVIVEVKTRSTEYFEAPLPIKKSGILYLLHMNIYRFSTGKGKHVLM